MDSQEPTPSDKEPSMPKIDLKSIGNEGNEFDQSVMESAYEIPTEQEALKDWVES